jgi:hypothetical protein
MFTIVALVLVVSNVCLAVLLKYGPKWRRARVEKESE